MANEVVSSKKTVVAEFKNSIRVRADDFRSALPGHLDYDRFERVIITAVTSNEDLLRADRKSLIQSAMKAAQDGLLPDGKQGAFVIYKNTVQWLPMIAGILKIVRQSGELLSIAAHVAYENDSFEFVLGDDERIDHRPFLEGARGNPRFVYAIAKTKDGGIYRDIMTVDEVEKVRAVSRAKKGGPWFDWWEEMAKKTVLRRLCKRLPMSTDLEQVMHRDDDHYDLNRRALPERKSLEERLANGNGKAAEGFSADHVSAHLGHTPDTIDVEATVVEPTETSPDLPAPLQTLLTALANAGAMEGIHNAAADFAEATEEADIELVRAGEQLAHIHTVRIESGWTQEETQKAVNKILERVPVNA